MMTQREFLNAILNGTFTNAAGEVESVVVDNEINNELLTYVREAITKLNVKNEKRKNSMTPKQKENEQLKAQILNMMEIGTAYTASAIGEAMELSTQRVSALMRQLENAGRVRSEMVATNKGRKVKGYFKLTVDENEEDNDVSAQKENVSDTNDVPFDVEETTNDTTEL